MFVTKWGTEGSGDGLFHYPEGVAMASDGSVYVADTSNHRIQKFTSEGVFVTKWGTFGGVHSGTGVDTADDGEFDQPHGVAVASDGSVYVLDAGNRRIQKFTSTGVFVSKWGGRDVANIRTTSGKPRDDSFEQAKHVAVASDGSVYVTDWNNHRIQKFTPEGVFVSQWGTYGTADGQFDVPVGVAVASDGSAYVADTYNNRIQKFSPGP